MNIDALTLFKSLSDETRLTSVLLIEKEGELCVCELTAALQVSQPKISRHLAQLRECGLLVDRREGQWVYYRINPYLPLWAQNVLAETRANNSGLLNPLSMRLSGMGSRPQRMKECC